LGRFGTGSRLTHWGRRGVVVSKGKRLQQPEKIFKSSLELQEKGWKEKVGGDAQYCRTIVLDDALNNKRRKENFHTEDRRGRGGKNIVRPQLDTSRPGRANPAPSLGDRGNALKGGKEERDVVSVTLLHSSPTGGVIPNKPESSFQLTGERERGKKSRALNGGSLSERE